MKWLSNVYTTTMDFPYSIYVWHAPRKPTDRPFWQEELRANYQQMAVYAATVLYNAGVPSQDSIRECDTRHKLAAKTAYLGRARNDLTRMIRNHMQPKTP
jgi:hypothetical protein